MAEEHDYPNQWGVPSNQHHCTRCQVLYWSQHEKAGFCRKCSLSFDGNAPRRRPFDPGRDGLSILLEAVFVLGTMNGAQAGSQIGLLNLKRELWPQYCKAIKFIDVIKDDLDPGGNVRPYVERFGKDVVRNFDDITAAANELTDQPVDWNRFSEQLLADAIQHLRDNSKVVRKEDLHKEDIEDRGPGRG